MTVQEFYTDESKWCKDTLSDGKGATCLLGALSSCHQTKGAYTQALGQLVAAIQAYVGYTSVARFNDAETTTFADIVKVVRMAGV